MWKCVSLFICLYKAARENKDRGLNDDRKMNGFLSEQKIIYNLLNV